MYITAVCLLSRETRVVAVIDQLNNLLTGNHKYKCVLVVDNKNIHESVIRSRLRIENTLFYTGSYGPPEGHLTERRERIVYCINRAKEFVDPNCDLIFMIEDDTEAHPDALNELIENYSNLQEFPELGPVGIVSGVQAGRHGFKMIGAWKGNDKQMSTVPYNGHDILEQVDATGFYFLVTPTKAFLETEIKHNFFGPDVNYGLDLTKKGYRNFINWHVVAKHITFRGVIVPDEKCVVLNYYNLNGKWTLEQTIKIVKDAKIS